MECKLFPFFSLPNQGLLGLGLGSNVPKWASTCCSHTCLPQHQYHYCLKTRQKSHDHERLEHDNVDTERVLNILSYFIPPAFFLWLTSLFTLLTSHLRKHSIPQGKKVCRINSPFVYISRISMIIFFSLSQKIWSITLLIPNVHKTIALMK